MGHLCIARAVDNRGTERHWPCIVSPCPQGNELPLRSVNAEINISKHLVSLYRLK